MENKVTPYCLSCGKIKVGDKWLLVGAEALAGYQLSHGYCDSCGEKAIEEAKREVCLNKIHKNHPEHQVECRKCHEFDYPYRMKDGLCVFCQPCGYCGKTDCEKTLDRDSSLRPYLCDDCYDSTMTIAERRQRNQEALC